MGKIDIFPEELLRVLRRELRKHRVTLVKNRRTGEVHLRYLPDEQPVPSEAQLSAKSDFGQLSHKASQWIKENKPEVCPPNGSPEYQRLMRAFKRQDKYKKFLNFVMGRMNQ